MAWGLGCTQRTPRGPPGVGECNEKPDHGSERGIPIRKLLVANVCGAGGSGASGWAGGDGRMTVRGDGSVGDYCMAT